MPRGTQVQRDGLVITVEGGAFQVGLFLGIWAAPWLHVQSAKDHNWEETALQGVGTRCQALKTIRTKIPQGSTHTKPILVTPEEPWVLITVGGQSADFLLDTEATYSVLTEAPGPLSSLSASVMGPSGWAKRYYGIISVILYVVTGILCYFHTRYWERSMPLFSWIWNPSFLSL